MSKKKIVLFTPNPGVGPKTRYAAIRDLVQYEAVSTEHVVALTLNEDTFDSSDLAAEVTKRLAPLGRTQVVEVVEVER